jgi:hypothetical protein
VKLVPFKLKPVLVVSITIEIAHCRMLG